MPCHDAEAKPFHLQHPANAKHVTQCVLRERGIHDGFDRKNQAVKMADVFGVEKLWRGIYESNRSHGDFEQSEVSCH